MNLLETLQIEVIKKNSEKVVLKMTVLDCHKQPFGLVHGGMYGILIETAASIGAMEQLEKDQIPVGIDLQVNHLKAVKSGTLKATAKPNHVGATLQVWEVTITNDLEEKIAVGRCSLLNKQIKKASQTRSALKQ